MHNDNMELNLNHDPMVDEKVNKEDWAYIADELSNIAGIDSIFKRMQSDEMRRYFKANTQEQQILTKTKYNFLSDLRKEVQKQIDIKLKKALKSS